MDVQERLLCMAWSVVTRSESAAARHHAEVVRTRATITRWQSIAARDTADVVCAAASVLRTTAALR